MLVAFSKPYGVLSQFTEEVPGQNVLSGFGFPPGIYPVGRLDADSEGLLLLSDEKSLVEKLLNPRHRHPRVYHAQVEGIPSGESIDRLRRGGLNIQGHRTLPCMADLLAEPPAHPPRDPPVRYRRHIPDCWLEMTLYEGKNRQVRRMTAAVGHPTLRLVRVAIGSYDLGRIAPGQWVVLGPEERRRVLEGRAK